MLLDTPTRSHQFEDLLYDDEMVAHNDMFSTFLIDDEDSVVNNDNSPLLEDILPLDHYTQSQNYTTTAASCFPLFTTTSSSSSYSDDEYHSTNARSGSITSIESDIQSSTLDDEANEASLALSDETFQLSEPWLSSRSPLSSDMEGTTSPKNIPLLPPTTNTTTTSNIVSKTKYGCDICGKRFKRPSSLSTHMNIHTGHKPYSCPFHTCLKRFNAKSNMLRHYKLHFRLDSGDYILPTGEIIPTKPTTRQLFNR